MRFLGIACAAHLHLSFASVICAFNETIAETKVVLLLLLQCSLYVPGMPPILICVPSARSVFGDKAGSDIHQNYPGNLSSKTKCIGKGVKEN
jgi:hypothetical protein